MDDRTLPWPEKGSLLMRLFVARQLSALVLDDCFTDIAPPEGARVLLYNETDAGLGDVAFATKLAWLFDAHLPGVELLIVTSDVSKQANFALPEGVRVIEEAAFRESGSPEDKAPTMVVSAPGIFDHCRSAKLAYERLGITEDVPFHYIAEYGSIRQLKDDAFKAMMPALDALSERFMDEVAEAHGLAPDDMGHSAKTGAVVGVFGEELRPLDHLLNAYRDLRDDNPMAAWLRAPLLSARSCGLELGELGIHLDGEVPWMTPDPAALEGLEDPFVRALLFGGKSPRSYGAETSLYVGYAYEGIGLFCDYVSLLEADTPRPLDLVCPHRDRVANLADIFEPGLRSRLKACGVGHIEIIGRAPEGELERVDIELGVGKTMRLITLYPIPHADFRRLHQAAHPATMVSGDQSFSDAVSMGKAILYLEPVYCQTYHLDAVLELAGALAPSAREVLNFGMQYRFDAQAYPALKAKLRSPTLWKDYQAFNNAIQKEHACGLRLMNLIKRALWTLRSPALRKAASTALDRAWSEADSEAGVTLKGADLERLVQSVSEGS